MSRGIIEVFNVDFLLISRSTLPTKSLTKISLLQEGIKDTLVTVFSVSAVMVPKAFLLTSY
jgi:hypothetical protein